MAKLKSVLERFKEVKQTLEDEKSKKGGSSKEFDNELFFKPLAVKGEDRTKFKIRFLPLEESATGKPWVKIDFHMFERPGDNKYIKCIDPRSFDPKAQNPIADLAKRLFDSGNALDNESARKYYKKARYFTLVYVKEAPENQKQYEGKVLIYEAGKQVFDKLDAAIKDFEKCFWDPYKGADFLLVLKIAGANEKWANYSDSAFLSDGPITSDEKKLDYIATQLEKVRVKDYIVSREGIKSGAELQNLLDGGERVSKINASPATDMVTNEKVSDTPDIDFGDVQTAAPVNKKVEAIKAQPAKPVVKETTSDEFDVEFNEDDFKV